MDAGATTAPAETVVTQDTEESGPGMVETGPGTAAIGQLQQMLDQGRREVAQIRQKPNGNQRPTTENTGTTTVSQNNSKTFCTHGGTSHAGLWLRALFRGICRRTPAGLRTAARTPRTCWSPTARRPAASVFGHPRSFAKIEPKIFAFQPAHGRNTSPRTFGRATATYPTIWSRPFNKIEHN